MKKGLKIKLSWIRLAVILNILLFYHFFYLFKFSDRLNAFLRKDFLVLFDVILYLFLLVIIYQKGRYRHVFYTYDKHLIRYFALLFLTIFAITVYSIIKYPSQRVVDILATEAPFLQIIAVPIYLMIFEKDNGEEKLLKTLNFISFLWSLIIIIAAYSYKYTGSLLFDINTYMEDTVGYIGTRVYGLRISLGCIGNFSILYNFNRLYKSKTNGLSKTIIIFELVIQIVALVTVQQTRAWTLIVGICIIIQILLGNKSRNTRTLEALSVVAVMLFLYFSGMLGETVSQFENMRIQSEGVSTTNRMYAVQYYLSVFLSKPIFGNGITSLGSIIYYNVEHGPLGVAYYYDVGVIGLLGQTGLCSIILYFIPFSKVMRSLSKMHDFRNILGYKYNLHISFGVYLILTSATLLITNLSLSPLFPILTAIILYNSKEVNSFK